MRAEPSAGDASSRVTMVGAAKNESFGCFASASTISSGSKPVLSGTKLNEPAATWDPEPGTFGPATIDADELARLALGLAGALRERRLAARVDAGTATLGLETGRTWPTAFQTASPSFQPAPREPNGGRIELERSLADGIQLNESIRLRAASASRPTFPTDWPTPRPGRSPLRIDPGEHSVLWVTLSDGAAAAREVHADRALLERARDGADLDALAAESAGQLVWRELVDLGIASAVQFQAR